LIGKIIVQQLYPCFGLSSLGLCSYNPAQPTPAYFTVGDAIAALGFMLAIQQLFRPIYLFRLAAYGLRILYLAWAVFLGALCSVVALLLPNLPLSHTGLFEYPITWELLGGLFIGGAYAVVGTVSLRPARLQQKAMRWEFEHGSAGGHVWNALKASKGDEGVDVLVNRFARPANPGPDIATRKGYAARYGRILKDASAPTSSDGSEPDGHATPTRGGNPSISPAGGPWVKSGGKEYATDANGMIVEGVSRPVTPDT
jgi:hypothetical protein